VATPERSVELGTIEVTNRSIDRATYVTVQAPFRSTARIDFGRQIRLLTATPGQRRLKAGLNATITCLFQSIAKVDPRYELRTELVGAVTRASSHVPVQGLAPLSTWRAGEYVRDVIALPTRTDDKAGTYRVMLSLFDTQTRRVVRPTGTGLPIAGDRIEIASFEIAP
jgi:hypothetical protein